jgi:hypothetical protein
MPVDLAKPEGVERRVELSEEELEAWCQAAAAYLSQRSTFWGTRREMREELLSTHARWQGIPVLCRRPISVGRA